MGTTELYEEKLRRGNLYYDTTIKPGLGSARCPRCLSLLNHVSTKGEWTIFPVLQAQLLWGCLVRFIVSITGIPYLQSRLKGPKGLVVGLPALLVVSGASAALGGQSCNATTARLVVIN